MEESSASAENLIFGRQAAHSLGKHHPTVPQIFRLWQTCLDNVNPLVKLFHAPTVQQMILDAVADMSSIPKSTEVLMFAIYLISVTSMNDQDCTKVLGQSRPTLLAKYSNATQQALVNTGFLTSTSLVVLQALTLYLVRPSVVFYTLSCPLFRIPPRPSAEDSNEGDLAYKFFIHDLVLTSSCSLPVASFTTLNHYGC
jgi:hypothetical protein